MLLMGPRRTGTRRATRWFPLLLNIVYIRHALSGEPTSTGGMSSSIWRGVNPLLLSFAFHPGRPKERVTFERARVGQARRRRAARAAAELRPQVQLGQRLPDGRIRSVSHVLREQRHDVPRLLRALDAQDV